MTSDGDLLQNGIEALRAGRAAEAVAPLQRFVTAQPDNFDGNNFLGVAMAQSGRAPEAITYLSKATRLNPQSAPAQYNLGLAYLNIPNTEAARSALHNALQLDPSHRGAREALSRLPGGAHTGAANLGAASQSSFDSATGAPSNAAASEAPSAAPGAEVSPWGFPEPATSVATIPTAPPARLKAADILRAGAYGLGAAILGAVVWDKITYHTGYEIGLIAVGVGWAVGSAVAAGAQGKSGRSLQVMGALLACFAMLLGQTLIVMEQGRDYLSGQGISPNPLALFIFSVMLVPRVLAESPLTFLFIAFGIWEGWRIPGATMEAAPVEATTPASSGTGSAT